MKADDFISALAGCFADEFKGGFVGFGAAVTVKNFSAECVAGEFFRQPYLRFVGEKIAVAGESAGLLADGVGYFGVTVSGHAACAETGPEVDIFPAVSVIYARTFSAYHGYGQSAVVGHQHFFTGCDKLTLRTHFAPRNIYLVKLNAVLLPAKFQETNLNNQTNSKLQLQMFKIDARTSPVLL